MAPARRSAGTRVSGSRFRATNTGSSTASSSSSSGATSSGAAHTPKRGGNHWLLIKERDGHVDERGTEAFPDDSIYSGLLVDQLAHPQDREAEIVAKARELGAPGGSGAVSGETGGFQVMLATAREEPFTKGGWVFEIKYDGYRLIADRTRGEPVLWSRNGNNITATFPDIARAIRGLPYDGYRVGRRGGGSR